jgi:nucleoid DNA-binding protein
MAKLSKAGLIKAIKDRLDEGTSTKVVKGVIEQLSTLGYKELKKNGSFVLPGFAKFVVKKKPATPERPGVNPFTKEPTVFKAKPASKTVKVRPVKALKDAVK